MLHALPSADRPLNLNNSQHLGSSTGPPPIHIYGMGDQGSTGYQGYHSNSGSFVRLWRPPTGNNAVFCG
ncbi:hypothetical protein CS8_032220 [Cupriavidus sp. 8B]